MIITICYTALLPTRVYGFLCGPSLLHHYAWKRCGPNPDKQRRSEWELPRSSIGS